MKQTMLQVSQDQVGSKEVWQAVNREEIDYRDATQLRNN